jgi:hypothetical protein
MMIANNASRSGRAIRAVETVGPRGNPGDAGEVRHDERIAGQIRDQAREIIEKGSDDSFDIFCELKPRDLQALAS